MVSSVFALKQRPDSPLRTLFGVGRSKDFKVMHELSNHVESLEAQELIAEAAISSRLRAQQMLEHVKQAEKSQKNLAREANAGNAAPYLRLLQSRNDQKQAVSVTKEPSQWQRLMSSLEAQSADRDSSRAKRPNAQPESSSAERLHDPAQAHGRLAAYSRVGGEAKRSSTHEHFRPSIAKARSRKAGIATIGRAERRAP